MSNLIISVDGKAGSGKAKIAKYIAEKYKLFHLDSGLLYRSLAYIIFKRKLKFTNIKILTEFINSIKILPSKNLKVLRKENIGKLASKIAKIQIVRNFVNKQQKIIVQKKLQIYRGCVIDGRDIGSKVFKNAKIKLFVEVSAEIRAKRRHKQLIELGEKSIYSQILKEINLRDKTDIERKNSPLVMPKGSLLINNSKSFNETISQLKIALTNI